VLGFLLVCEEELDFLDLF